jgi:hypothetical protein
VIIWRHQRAILVDKLKIEKATWLGEQFSGQGPSWSIKVVLLRYFYEAGRIFMSCIFLAWRRERLYIIKHTQGHIFSY